MLNEKSAQDLNFRRRLATSETAWPRIKFAIFQTFIDIYNHKYHSQLYPKSEKPIIGIVNALATLQMMTQLWYPSINISNWEAYSPFWNAIGFSSIDFICASLNNGLSFCFYGSIVFVFAMAISLIALTFFCFIKKKVHPAFISIPRKIILISTNIGHIPIMMILILWVKFSTNQESISDNYPYAAESSGALNFKESLQGLGISSIIVFNIILIAGEIFSTETRHSYLEKNILARTKSFPDVLGCICNSIFVCVFTFIEKEFWIYGLYVFSIVYFIIGLIFYIEIPYYNSISNYIKVARHFMCSFTACSFILGMYMNNAQVIFLMALVINPLLTLISLYFLNKRINSLIIKAPRNQFSFELKIRKHLITPDIENKQEIINKFSECFSNKSFKLGKLLGVWEAYFCVDRLKDVRLATVKLARINTIYSNIEECYQEFICRKNLKLEGFIMYEDTAFLKYLKNMNKAKNDDREMLFDILNFSDEISLRRPNVARIQDYSRAISYKIKFLKKKYSKLVLRFPNMITSKRLYGSFLRDIMSEKDHNYLVFITNESAKQSPVKPNEISKINTFDETHGILWTSAEMSSFGDIIYVNEIFSQMLGYQMSDLLDSSLNTLIPFPFVDHHNRVMKNFIGSCYDLEAKVPTTLFMKNKSDLLVECSVRSRLIALDSYRFFLSSTSQIDTTRECALLAEDFTIYNYTTNFISWLNTPHESIKHTNIIEYIPEYANIAKNPFMPYLTTIHGKHVAIVHEIRRFSTVNMNIALIISDPEEISAWSRGVHEDQTVYHYGGEKTNSKLTEALSMEVYGKKDIEEELKVASEHIQNSNSKYKIDLFEVEDRSAASSTRSKFYRNLKAGNQHNLINQSILSIKIFGWVVFWTLIAIIIASTVQLIYSSQEIYAASSINTISDLGQVLYTLANVAINARLSDWSIRVKSAYIDYNLQIVNDSLDELKDAESSLLNNSDDWAYCSSTNLINVNIIPTWTYINNDTMILTNVNLIDGIQEFVKHGVHYLSFPYDLDAHFGDLYFLVNNGIGDFYNYLNQTFDSLVDCEIQKVNGLNQNIYILYIFDMIVLIVGLAVLAFFSIRLNKMQDKLWIFLAQLSQLVIQNIRENCINRLYEVHGYDDTIQIKAEIIFKKGSRIKANYIWSVLWRISIIFICALVFETVRTFYLYENCQQLLIKRSGFLKIANLRRNYMVELNLWFREANGVARNLTLYQFYPKSYHYENWRTEFFSLMEKIKYVNNLYHSSEYTELLSENTKNEIYSNSSYPGFPFLDYGTYASYNLAIQDVYQSAFVAYNTRYVYNFTTFTVANENAVISKINQDSKDKVTSQVNFIFYLSLLYMILSFVACFAYYIPYLRNEIKKLRELQDLIYLLEAPLKLV